MFDPASYYDEQMRRLTGGAYGGGPAAQPSPFPPYTDEQTESALGQLGQKVLGGVGYVGGLLDKTFGGRALRGVLGGKPREALSLLPFSDTLGLTDENDVVHGRDLLENAGLVEHGVPGSGLDLGDVAGFGLDVALDPSAYLGNWAGALGKATGATALAGRALSKVPGVARAGEALAPVGRGLKAMFQQSVHNTTSAAGQAAMQGFHEALPAAEAALKKRGLDLFEGLREPLPGVPGVGGALPPGAAEEFAHVMEGNLPGPAWAPAPAAPGPAAQQVAGGTRQLLDERWQALHDLGVDVKRVENYLPESRTPVLPGGNKGGGTGSGALDPSNRNMIGREHELFGDLPRRGWVNPLVSDPEAAVPDFFKKQPLDRREALLQNVLYPLEDVLSGTPRAGTRQLYGQAERAELAALDQQAAAGATLTPAEEARRATLTQARAGLGDQAGRLADALASPEWAPYREHKLALFGGDPMQNVLDYLGRSAGSEGKTKALYGLLQNVAGPAGADTVPITEALGRMTHLDQSAAQNVLAGQMGLTPQQLAGLHVPAEVADDVGRAIRGFTTPTALEPIARAVDSFTSLFRGLNSALLPTRVSRFSRNLGQQLWGMWVAGHDLGAVPDAYQLLRSGPDFVLPDAHTVPYLAGRNLTPAQATRELQKDLFATGAAGPSRTTGKLESTAPGAVHQAQAAGVLPGSAQPGLGEIARSAVPGSWEEAKPWNLRGVGGREVTTFAPGRAGQELDTAIDDATRGGSWLDQVRRGKTPAEAAAEVRKVHYDYGNLSDAEKAIMRRVFPFYSWVRQNVPAQLSQLWESPGGKTAQAIRATGDLRQSEGFLPPDVAEGIGLPVGPESEGTRRYLTSLGLPFEDLGDLVTGRGAVGNVGRTLANVMSQANPLLKAPVELATGEQLVSGRRLEDLYGPTGNVLADQAIMNAPGSSAYTGVRTLLDPRKDALVKATNLLSPAKFTDVDMDKRRDVAARELVSDLLRQYPQVHEFTQPWVRPEDAAALDPQAAELMKLYRGLEQRSQQKAREQKKVGVRR